MHGAERAGDAPRGGGAGILTTGTGDTDRCGGPGETETVAPLCLTQEFALETGGPGETDKECGFE